ncbi:MAG: AAA family ATPase, partial [Calditrichaeota bacterium]|nr:AAA family ATPase [Calditrichota bacterium]
MIKRLYIDGYKSFKDFEVELQPLSVIFGPNGSGKSNLIDAIQLLSALCTSKRIADAFEDHRGDTLESFYYGDVGFDENMKKDKLEMTFEVDVEISESSLNITRKLINERRSTQEQLFSERLEKHLRYSVTIYATTSTGYIKVIREKLTALDSKGQEKDDQTGLISSVIAKGSVARHEDIDDIIYKDDWPPSTRISMADRGAILPSAYA